MSKLVGKRLRKKEYNRAWIAEKRRKSKLLNSVSASDKETDDDSMEEVQIQDDNTPACTIRRPEVSKTDNRNIEDLHEQNKTTETVDDHHDEIDSRDREYLDNLGSDMCFDTYIGTDSDSELSDTSTDGLIEELRAWTDTFNIAGNAVDNLLKIFKRRGHQDLPATARGLLKTPRAIETRVVSKMDYFHFGLHKMLINYLKRFHMDADATAGIETLHLALNIDGLPLFKSSNISVWPVLCFVTNLKPCRVFPISISVGKSKPSNLDFLQGAIDDLKEAIQQGIECNGKRFQITVRSVVCDAPAKALVKCIKQYSGYYGCDKCCQEGRYFGRMTYPEITNIELRTDESFRRRDQEEHHKGISPFEELTLDMVADFPVDYMHQLCLGVVRKLICLWTKGPRAEYKLSPRQVALVNSSLIGMRKYIPREFARKPRGLDEVDRWKATEFKQFLLYTGHMVLKHELPREYYNHFMALSVASSILVNSNLAAEHGDYAHQLLLHFVSKGRELYGREFLVYNVHSLVHIQQEAVRFGNLDNCAAWKFENYMQILKRKVRNGKNPAVQIAKRILEQTVREEDAATKPVKQIYHRRPDNTYRTDAGKYCEVMRINSEGTYLCRVYKTPESLFSQPCDSRMIGFCKFNKSNYDMRILDKTALRETCVTIDHGNNRIFLTLLHDHDDFAH